MNLGDDNCSTALMVASKNGRINIARELIANGVAIYAKLNPGDVTTFTIAPEGGCNDIVNVLLEVMCLHKRFFVGRLK